MDFCFICARAQFILFFRLNIMGFDWFCSGFGRLYLFLSFRNIKCFIFLQRFLSLSLSVIIGAVVKFKLVIISFDDNIFFIVLLSICAHEFIVLKIFLIYLVFIVHGALYTIYTQIYGVSPWLRHESCVFSCIFVCVRFASFLSSVFFFFFFSFIFSCRCLFLLFWSFCCIYTRCFASLHLNFRVYLCVSVCVWIRFSVWISARLFFFVCIAIAIFSLDRRCRRRLCVRQPKPLTLILFPFLTHSKTLFVFSSLSLSVCILSFVLCCFGFCFFVSSSFLFLFFRCYYAHIFYASRKRDCVRDRACRE